MFLFLLVPPWQSNEVKRKFVVFVVAEFDSASYEFGPFFCGDVCWRLNTSHFEFMLKDTDSWN
jgi:hypothetical protein